MNAYRKLIAGICSALATWLTTSFADGGISVSEIAGLGAVILGSVAVWFVPNSVES